MTNKLSKKITVKSVVLAVAAFTMSSVMVVDAIDFSPPVASLESDGVESLPSLEPEPIQSLPVTFEDETALSVKKNVTDTAETRSQMAMAQAVTPVIIRYEMDLPESTMQALTAVEEEYRATLKYKANLAKIKAQSSDMELENGSLKTQPILEVKGQPPVVMDATDQVSSLALKSIVSSPSHKCAWFERHGQLFPVKEGTWIGDFKVYRIDQTMVSLIDKQGMTHQKHMPTRKIDKPKKAVVNGLY